MSTDADGDKSESVGHRANPFADFAADDPDPAHATPSIEMYVMFPITNENGRGKKEGEK